MQLNNRLDGARNRRVLVQEQVRARHIVVIQIRPQRMTEMRAIEAVCRLFSRPVLGSPIFAGLICDRHR
jgi:hypothetical protein